MMQWVEAELMRRDDLIRDVLNELLDINREQMSLNQEVKWFEQYLLNSS